MDFGTLSPDVDARFCYLIVMLAGMLTAVREVDSRLAKIPGAWSDIGAHRLFAFFWVTPVVLFFLLDHAGAINDTSPIAAVVVAVTYATILGGASGQQPLLPSQVTGLWSKLLGDVDKIQAAAQSRMQLRVFDYARGAANEISARPARYTKLVALAKRLVGDPAALDKSLADIDAQYPGDTALATYKKVEALMRALNSVYVARGLNDEVHVLLRKERLIGWRTYSSFPGEQVGGIWRTLSVLIPAAVMASLVAVSMTDHGNFERSWFEWRLSKANVSLIDLTRTREAMIDRIVRSPEPLAELAAVGRIVREANLPPVRTEAAIGILTDGVRQRRDRDRLMPELVATLVVSLRTANLDARNRIHATLLYLADAVMKGGPENKDAAQALVELGKWKPNDKESISDLAARIDEWRRFFTRLKLAN